MVRAGAHLLASLRRRVHPKITTGYVDHVESIQSPPLRERLALRRMRRSQSGVRFEDLSDPREKTRYLYRKLMQSAVTSGFPWSKSATPREISKELQAFVDDDPACKDIPNFINLYSIARYSQHPVDNDVVETAYIRLGKLLLFGRSGKRRR